MSAAVTFTTPAAVAVAGVPRATACPHTTAGPVVSLGRQPRWCQALGQRRAGLGGSETPQEHPRKRWENRWCPSCSRSALETKQIPLSLPLCLLLYLAPPNIWRIWRWVGAAGAVIYPCKQQRPRDRA